MNIAKTNQENETKQTNNNYTTKHTCGEVARASAGDRNVVFCNLAGAVDRFCSRGAPQITGSRHFPA